MRRRLIAGSALACCLAVPAAHATAGRSSAARANLKVTAVKDVPKGDISAGATLTLRATITNAGSATAGKSTTELVLSADGKRSKQDVSIGTVTTKSLKRRAKVTVKVAGTLPASTPSGTYRLLVCADSAKRIREASESDNCRASRKVSIRAVAPSSEGTAPPQAGPPAPQPPAAQPPADAGPQPTAAPSPTPAPTAAPTPSPTPKPGPPKVSIADGQVTEGTGGASQLSLMLTLDHPAEGEVSVAVRSEDGTAVADSDYEPVDARVIFPAGSTSQALVITIAGDAIDEANETFAIELSDPRGATIDRARGVGTILDDDDPAPPGPILIDIDDAAVTEGDAGKSTATLPLHLSRAASSPVTVHVATTGGGDATEGQDYEAASGTVTFAAGATTASFGVPILGDGAPEPDEHVAVALSDPTGAAIGDGVAQITILDDDATPDAPPVPPNAPADRPPVDPTEALGGAADEPAPADFASGVDFIYRGSDPIQTGVAQGAVSDRRAAVLRGRLLTTSGVPISGARVEVLGHPELGRTASRDDGRFDLVVNGGGDVVVDIERAGYLPVQRTVKNAPWQDYAEVGDVVLRSLTRAVDQVDLSSSTPTVAAGPTVDDDAGRRQSTLVFPSGTAATATRPDGSTVDLSTLAVRSTEYTAGSVGPDAMPGDLPPTTGFTYAVELSADEAVRLGAEKVSFDRPVLNYVDNFLGLTAGTRVPAGYYDRDLGQWVAGPDGVVIDITAIRDGLADVDITGDGAAETPTELLGIGMDEAERTVLATRWSAGASLWRMSITHFTPWDYNYPYAPPEDAEDPDKPWWKRLLGGACGKGGSIIHCESQSLGESINLPGTGMTLNYASDRVAARPADRSVDYQIADDLPPSAKAVVLTLKIAGRTVERTFAPTPGGQISIAWDGLDAYGRPVTRPATGTIEVSYRYALEYQQPVAFAQSFARLSGRPMRVDRGGGAVDLTAEREVTLGGMDARSVGLGGWTLSGHHALDPATGTVYLGDGGTLDGASDSFGPQLLPYLGTGDDGDAGDGSSAELARVRHPAGVAVGPDGTVYVTDPASDRVRAVGADGKVRTVAGNGSAGFSGDGGRATQAQLSEPSGVAVGPDGSVYIADSNNNRIRRVTASGTITTVAGGGNPADGLGDNAPALAARLRGPTAVAVAPGGGLWIADTNAHRIRLVGADGVITTAAGTGIPGRSATSGPAIDSELQRPTALTVDARGRLIIAEGSSGLISRIGTDGVIERLAGGGTPDDGIGDGNDPLAARLSGPSAVAVSADGDIYIADAGAQRIRRLVVGRSISTFAGAATTLDTDTAYGSALGVVSGLGVRRDGAVLFAEGDEHRVRMIAPRRAEVDASDRVVASAATNELFVFDGNGRHLRTLNAITGQTTRRFEYTADGMLSRIDEGDGNVLSVERDNTGAPTAIVGAFGARTAVDVGSDGMLASVTEAAGLRTTMAYRDRLLTSFSPGGAQHEFEYDADGRLTRDRSASRDQRLTRTRLDDGVQVQVRSVGGPADVFRWTAGDDDTQQRSVKRGDRPFTTATVYPDGRMTVDGANGASGVSLTKPDDRFGRGASQVASTTLTTPAGRSVTSVLSSSNDAAPGAGPFGFALLQDQQLVSGRGVRSTYDAVARTASVSTDGGVTASAKFDADGRLIEQRGGTTNAPETYAYDARGRMTSVTQAGRTSAFSYDAAGWLRQVANPGGAVQTFTRDASGRPTEIQTTGRPAVGISYDERSNVESVTSAGRTRRYTYDGDDRVLSVEAPPRSAGDSAPRTTRMSYDGAGRLATVDRPGRSKIELAYDESGGLATATVDGQTTRYTRSPAGELAAVDNGAVRVEAERDGALELGTRFTGAVAGSVTREFDARTELASTSVNGDPVATYRRDSDGQIVGIGPLEVTRRAGDGLVTGSSIGSLGERLTYDAFGELTGVRVARGDTVLFEQTLARAPSGRITQTTENGEATAYERDAAEQLTKVVRGGQTIASYAYDARGNRVSATAGSKTQAATYDGQDELITAGPETFSYSDGGDVRERSTAGGSPTRYTYDAFGRMTRAALADGRTVTYTTDGAGRRVRRTATGEPTVGWLYGSESAGPVAQLDGANSVVATFGYSRPIGAAAYMRRSGHTYYLATDYLGSVRRVIDIDTGAIEQQLDYDAWGQVTRDTNPGFQPFGYAGGIYDPTTGLVRFGARDYDAATGRWMAEDPLGLAGGDPNLHRYASNDPVSITDPTGNFGMIATAVVGCGVSAGISYLCGERRLSALATQCAAGALSGLVGGFGLAGKAGFPMWANVTKNVAGPSLGRQVAAQAAASVTSTAITTTHDVLVDGKDVSLSDVATQVVVSTAIGVLPGHPGPKANSVRSNMKPETRSEFIHQRKVEEFVDPLESSALDFFAGFFSSEERRSELLGDTE